MAGHGPGLSPFEGEEARAVFAGLAGHAILDLGRPITSSFGLMFAASAHAVGWPLAKGGSQRVADALASYLRSLGGWWSPAGGWLRSTTSHRRGSCSST